MPILSRSVAGLIVAVALAMPTAVAAKEFRYHVSRGATVSVVNNYGRVRVHPSSSNEVVVNAVPAAKADAEAAQSSNRIEVRTRLTQGATESDGAVTYDVQVPSDANVIVHTASGPVEVQAVNGDLSVDTETGKVEVRDSSGHVQVRTVAGPITLGNLKNGAVEATSVTGSITSNGVSGKVVKLDTTGGMISYTGDFAGGGQYSLSSHSGDIDVALPAGASVDISARTVTGTLENNFPLKTTPGSPTPDHGKSFAGTSSTGASTVRLQTFSGKIRIKKQ